MHTQIITAPNEAQLYTKHSCGRVRTLSRENERHSNSICTLCHSAHTHTHITQRYSTDIDTHNAIKCCRRRRHTNNFYKWNKSPGPAESAAQPAKSSGATHTHTQKKRAMSCACERALAHMHMRTEQDLSIRGARVQIVRARARVRAFA